MWISAKIMNRPASTTHLLPQSILAQTCPLVAINKLPKLVTVRLRGRNRRRTAFVHEPSQLRKFSLKHRQAEFAGGL